MAEQPNHLISQLLDLIGLSALFAAIGALTAALYFNPAAPISLQFLFDAFLGALAIASISFLTARLFDISYHLATAPSPRQMRSAAEPAPAETVTTLGEAPAEELPRAA